MIDKILTLRTVFAVLFLLLLPFVLSLLFTLLRLSETVVCCGFTVSQSVLFFQHLVKQSALCTLCHGVLGCTDLSVISPAVNTLYLCVTVSWSVLICQQLVQQSTLCTFVSRYPGVR